ncbi:MULTISPECIES: hypothetical protein [unclassified Moorena]|nr:MULTISPECIES: hypothetical protein [unclassified Moorena]
MQVLSGRSETTGRKERLTFGHPTGRLAIEDQTWCDRYPKP